MPLMHMLQFSLLVSRVISDIRVTWLITLVGGGKIGHGYYNFKESRKRQKMGLFHFFPPLHHPKNHFKNVSIFCLSLFKSVAKEKLFLGTKIP